jgi:hypothetical protein
VETINPEVRKRVAVVSYLDRFRFLACFSQLLNGTQCSVVIKAAERAPQPKAAGKRSPVP